ncbi:MAG: transcription initiation protein [Myxococcales bacterium]|nr:MAG: transcription initiation protein [Myxococcales bacterium]
MSDFVFLLRSSEPDFQEAMGTPERAQKSLQAWLAWIAELETAGQLKSPGLPLERAGKWVRGKQQEVTDSPLAEAKDMVIGFIVISARDLDEAVSIAQGCPIVRGGGAVEIRPVLPAPA